jgi:hypothetical protein
MLICLLIDKMLSYLLIVGFIICSYCGEVEQPIKCFRSMLKLCFDVVLVHLYIFMFC